MSQVVGLLGALIMTASALYYLCDMLRGRSRPQRASWTVWAVVGMLGFATADAGGAGPGAYAAGIDAIACAATFLISLSPRFGKPGGRRIDWVLAGLGLVGVVLWQWGPLTTTGAALAAVGCDAIAMYPTLREAWRQPHFESLLSWGADVLGSSCGVVAVTSPSVAALAFPVYLVVSSAAVWLILLARRGGRPGVTATPVPVRAALPRSVHHTPRDTSRTSSALNPVRPQPDQTDRSPQALPAL